MIKIKIKTKTKEGTSEMLAYICVFSYYNIYVGKEATKYQVPTTVSSVLVIAGLTPKGFLPKCFAASSLKFYRKVQKVLKSLFYKGFKGIFYIIQLLYILYYQSTYASDSSAYNLIPISGCLIFCIGIFDQAPQQTL